MLVNQATICGIALDFSRAKLDKALGEPTKCNPILDDNELILSYTDARLKKGPQFGTPPGGLTVRLDSGGKIRAIHSRRSPLEWGALLVRMLDHYEDVLVLLRYLSLEYEDGKDRSLLAFSDATGSLRIKFRAGFVNQFELRR